MKRLNLVSLIAVLVGYVLPVTLSAQVDTTWVRRYDGPGDTVDVGYRVVVDRSGNVFVAGTSVGTGNGKDFVVIKYSPIGTEQWLRRYDGPAHGLDSVTSMAVDNAGNIYVCGLSTGTTSSTDFATVKFNTAGDTLWVRRYDGPGNRYDCAIAVTVGRSGNIHVTGYSYGGTVTGTNYATIKYTPAGDTLWVRRYNPQDNFIDVPTGIVVDSVENVWVTGRAAEGLTGSTFYATVKYNSAGVEQWAREYGQGWDEPTAIAVDAAGNAYVTGSSYDYSGQGHLLDYLTIKYNSAGTLQWARRFNGPADGHDGATAVAVGASGGVYVTGWSLGNGTNFDFATMRYNSAGDTVWVRRYNGPGMGPDWGTALVLDRSDNVYVTGLSVEGGGSQDYMTLKYTSASDTVWRQSYDGTGYGNDIAYSIALDDSGYVCVTGASPGTGGDLDFATVRYSQRVTGVEQENDVRCSILDAGLRILQNPTTKARGLRLLVNGNRGEIRLQIYDVTGKLVSSHVLNPMPGAPCSIALHLSAGVYFIKAGVEGRAFVEKLVVTK